MPRRWTAEEYAVVQEHYERAGDEPVDIEAIAKALGRSYASVALKASRRGWAKQDRNKIPGGEKPRPTKYATREELLRAMGERTRKLWAERGHPRGMLGKRHSQQLKDDQSARSKAMWRDPNAVHNTPEYRQALSDRAVRRTVARVERRAPPTGHNRTASTAGTREDLGIYVRSSWEANYARYLQWLQSMGKIAGWDYEPKTFVFEKISRGTRTYTPDFRVDNLDGTHEWHEVKGWMDQKSRTRLDRMRRYFPEEKVVVIGESWFSQASKQGLGAIVPGWETPEKKRHDAAYYRAWRARRAQSSRA